MQNKTIITSYLDDLWQASLMGVGNTAFFNTHDTHSFSAYLDHYLSNLLPKPLVFRCLLTNQPYAAPFHPFLSFLQDYFATHPEIEIEHFLNEAGVYHFQQPVFSSYFRNGQAERPEEIILEELDYEKKQMLDSIFNLFCMISRTAPLVIVVENIHHAKPSTIEFLHSILLKTGTQPILCIFSLNDFCLPTSETAGLFDELKNQGKLIYFSTNSNPAVLATEEPQAPSIAELIQLGRNCLHFLALLECRAVMEHVYQERLLGGKELPCDLEIYQILGDVHNYLAENDLALTYYNTLLRLAQQNNDLLLMSDAYRKIGLIYLKKDDSVTAERYGNQSLKIAEELNNSLQLFRAYFLLYMVVDKARNFNRQIKKWFKTYKKLIGLAKKLNKLNTLAYCCTNPYGTYCQQGNDEENLFNYGISIAQKNNNQYRIATAYQFTGLMYSIRGEYPQVLKYYKKSEKLKLQLGNKLELAHIYNGLGFYYFMTENFPKAYTYFCKALSSLTSIRDNHEIGMTLCNIAFNAYAGFNHRFSNRYLEMVLKILRILQMKGLRYHSLCMIYSLMGINYCKLGDSFKAKECMLKIVSMQLKPYTKNNEEYALFFFFKAMLHRINNEYEQAEKFIQKAISTLERQNYIVKYLAPRFYYEYALMAVELTQFEKANILVKSGLEISTKLNFPFHTKLLQMVIEPERPPVKAFRFKKLPLNFEAILESAKAEANIVKLHKRMNEINFLNALQNVIEQANPDKKDLLFSATNLIRNSFLVDRIYCYLWENNAWQHVELYNPNEKEPPDHTNLLQVLTSDPVGKIIYDTSEDPTFQGVAKQFNSIISLPLHSGERVIGHLLCATVKKEIVFTHNDFQVLFIAAKQLAAAIEKIERDQALRRMNAEILERERLITQKNRLLHEANHKLTIFATTDSLTGLANRQAILTILEEEKDRLQHIPGSEHLVFSLLFVDLDNFKFCNDTFGHYVGDLVLRRFAELLRLTVHDTGITARFGGDEFIVFLPNYSPEQANILANQILEALSKAKQFCPEIETMLGHPVDIPENRRISCSIGVSHFSYGSGFKFEDMIRQADLALNLAKRSGKNCVHLWNEADDT